MFLTALVLRLVFLFHLFETRPPETMWGSNEAGLIARSLVAGHGFGSTFHDYNGPTAWLAPGYPSLVALVFLFCGIETHLSAVVLMVLNAVFSSLTALVVCKMGSHVFDRVTGLAAGWAWAVCPMGTILTFLVWDSCLCALMMSLAVWAWIKADGTLGWVRAGVVWGIAGLVNPSLLAPLPLLLAFSWWRAKNLKACAWVLLSCGLLLLPWSLRNELTFHRAIPIRSNLWAEVYFGNVSFALHPLGPTMEYQRMGEIAFVDRLKEGAIEHIRNHPWQFVRDTFVRAVLFWIAPLKWLPLTIPLALGTFCGLGLAMRNAPARSLPLIVSLLSYPLIYCISYVYSRYRHPIEPLMYLLAAYAVCEGTRAIRKSKASINGQTAQSNG
jgi:hypothetical protein